MIEKQRRKIMKVMSLVDGWMEGMKSEPIYEYHIPFSTSEPLFVLLFSCDVFG